MAILRELTAVGLPDAKAWLEKVEAESNDEQSQQSAVTGLREITRRTRRRLVVFVENLNLLLEECLDDLMKGTLRRLLMTDPFMMIIGNSVHVFDSLKSYEEAFFNYFGPVPLDRLNAEQVFELPQRRAFSALLSARFGRGCRCEQDFCDDIAAAGRGGPGLGPPRGSLRTQAGPNWRTAG